MGRWSQVSRLVPFSPREWRILRPLMLVGYFESYSGALITVGAATIAAGLGVSTSAFAIGAAIVQLAGLGAIPVVRLADELGRRRLLLVSMAGFTIATALTAISWSLAAFVAFSCVMRVFLETEDTVATTAIAEEVRDDRRGNALAVLGAIAGLGSGSVAILLLFENSELGWRILYVWPLALMPLVAYLRRHLAETAAFERARLAHRITGFWPTVDGRFRPWIWRLSVIQLMYGATQTAALLYASDLARNVYHWSGRYTLVIVASAPFGTVGLLFGGRISDRIGRRPGTALALAGMGASVLVIFGGGEALFAVGFWLAVLAQGAQWPVIGAYVAELFPTEVRPTMHSFVLSFQTVGGALGLLVVGVLAPVVGVTEMMVGLGVACACSMLCLLGMPETRGADLAGPARA
ncbi:MAG TPA: MFS transporter [Acidimicrobiia bacterium]